MIDKSTLFLIFQTSSSAPPIIFADGSLKCISGTRTVNLTSLTLLGSFIIMYFSIPTMIFYV